MPEVRVKEAHAFSSVGVDFAGPLYVKNQSNTLDKVYLTIFICATTRAIHLELVTDLSTNSFLLCLKRFVNSLLQKQVKVKSNSVNNYLINRKITWKFNLAKALWWGGFYKCLIQSVKSCLRRISPLQKLFPLELAETTSELELNNPLDSSNEIETRRPTRKAARVAAKRIKLIDQLENE